MMHAVRTAHARVRLCHPSTPTLHTLANFTRLSLTTHLSLITDLFSLIVSWLVPQHANMGALDLSYLGVTIE